MMNIKYEYDKARAIIIPPDRIDVNNSEVFYSYLLSAYKREFTQILVDFTHVKSLDSSGFSRLLLINKRLKDQGGELRIINVKNSTIWNMLKAVNLHRVIHIEGMC